VSSTSPVIPIAALVQLEPVLTLCARTLRDVALLDAKAKFARTISLPDAVPSAPPPALKKALVMLGNSASPPTSSNVWGVVVPIPIDPRVVHVPMPSPLFQLHWA
jgi:hypothetical protein